MLRGTRVLYVEDNIVNQMVVKKILEWEGIIVNLAENGQQGVDFTQTGGPDIVLMDCAMPVMNGFEATKQIRQFNQRIPILALTANVTATDKHLCYEAGMDDFLTKPIDRELLLAKIASHLQGIYRGEVGRTAV